MSKLYLFCNMFKILGTLSNLDANFHKNNNIADLNTILSD